MSRLEIIKQDDGRELIKYLVRTDPTQPEEFLNPKNYTVCGAWLKEKKKPCLQPAGKRTDHEGWGRCYLHGGATQSPLSKRNQKKLSLIGEVNYPGLREEIERLKLDKDVFDLREEIFTMEAIANKILEKAETLDDMAPAIGIIDRATRIAQRLHEIEVGRKYVVDVRNINVIIEYVVNVVDRYVTDQYTKNLIAKDLASMKIGSGFPRPTPKGEVIDAEEVQ